MEHNTVLERRKSSPLTPYKAEVWERELKEAGLLTRFAKIPEGIRFDFNLNFPKILHNQLPPNKISTSTYKDQFNASIQKEIQTSRYIEPGKPGKFRLIQNFSFPHSFDPLYPNPSINSHINSNDFPTTWGKFSVVYLLISRLPPGSEAATRDVAEAYRTIPLHPSQWPAAVVRTSDTEFCVDTCTVFGATPSAGAYGHIADAGAEILRKRGIGPLDKWVDDHIFFRIRKEFRNEYNQKRAEWHQDLAKRGMHQTGSRLWYGGRIFDNGSIEEFSEDCSQPILDLSNNSPRSEHDLLFCHNLQDIDDASSDLGILWQLAKDQPFASSTIYIGFLWDLDRHIVSLSQPKVDKYLMAIHTWRKKPIHVLQEVLELYGKLMHACAAVTRGRAYLTSLERTISVLRLKPLLPQCPDKDVLHDLDWWSELLQSGGVSRPIRPPAQFSRPNAFSDASSSIGIGIVIGDRWRAWRLVPGWQTAENGKRDIGWAEAIGFELLVRTLAALPNISEHVIVYGDNTGVVEGWWRGSHRNKAVNAVFKRIHEFIFNLPRCFEIRTEYVVSESNPADEPSRGIYGPEHLLLPLVPIPNEIRNLVIDATSPLTPTELRLFRNGQYSVPAAKIINRTLMRQQAFERDRASRAEEDKIIFNAISQ